MPAPTTQGDLDLHRVQLQGELGRRSLSQFIKFAWGQLEPNRLLWNWHIDAMTELLEAVSVGDIKRLLINVPPGCMKSLTVSTFWPAWDWIETPARRFIASTYSQSLSNKNAKLHRDLVRSEWFEDRWPHVRIDATQSTKVEKFGNSCGGWRMSTSVTGRLTGEHGHILLWDDLVNAKDAQGRASVNQHALKRANEFRFESLVTRMADPQSTAIVGIMQRLHYGDPSQRCIDQGDHVVLCLPMEYNPKRTALVKWKGGEIEDPRTEEGELLWPDRFPKEVVDDLRKNLGSLAAAAQLDQNPSPLKGAIFEREWLEHTWDKVPPKGKQIITVDCTFKDADTSDYVVLQVWARHNNKFLLLDQQRGKWKVTKTAAKLVKLTRKWPKARGIYVEDKANGPALMQILEDQVSGLIGWNPGRSSKVERAESVSALFEAGDVQLPINAPWKSEYVSELLKFPVDIHDDQVDCTTMALLILHTPKKRRLIEAYRKAREVF